MHYTRFLLPLAALAMLGAASPQLIAPQARDLKTMSLQDRMTLPATTKITLGKATTTLGALRANHNALVASRQRVKTLSMANLRTVARADHSFAKSFGTAIRLGHSINLGAPAPANSVTAASRNGFAADYQQFCNSVPATVCLYYPPGVAWYAQDQHGNYQTVDALITDANVCTQEGGSIGTLTSGPYSASVSGCIYTYPSAQSVNFLPPAKGFTTTGWCNATSGNFSSRIDQHGAVQIQDAGISGFYASSGWGGTYTGGNTPNLEQFCFLQVTLAH